MVSCTYVLLCPRSNNPPVVIEYEAGGSLNTSWRFIEQKSLLPLPGIELIFIGRPVRNVIGIWTELFRFCIFHFSV